MSCCYWAGRLCNPTPLVPLQYLGTPIPGKIWKISPPKIVYQSLTGFNPYILWLLCNQFILEMILLQYGLKPAGILWWFYACLPQSPFCDTGTRMEPGLQPCPLALKVETQCCPISTLVAQYRCIMARAARCGEQLLVVVYIKQVAGPQEERQTMRRSKTKAGIYECVSIYV